MEADKTIIDEWPIQCGDKYNCSCKRLELMGMTRYEKEIVLELRCLMCGHSFELSAPTEPFEPITQVNETKKEVGYLG